MQTGQVLMEPGQVVGAAGGIPSGLALNLGEPIFPSSDSISLIVMSLLERRANGRKDDKQLRRPNRLKLT